MQRGSIEHEQISYESSNRRMKQLMDWLSLAVKLTLNPRHRNADLPPLSNSSKQRCTGQEWSPFAWVPLLRGGKSAFLCLGFSVSLTASPLVVSYGG